MNFVIQPTVVVNIVVILEGIRVLVSIAIMCLRLIRGLLWELDLRERRRERLVGKVGRRRHSGQIVVALWAERRA